MGKIARQLSLEALVSEYIPPHQTVAVGGLHFHNTPMALVRELIRQKTEIACLVPPLDGSINADQLIGAELVDQVLVAYLGLIEKASTRSQIHNHQNLLMHYLVF